MRHQMPRTSIGGDGSPTTPIMPTRSPGSHLVRRRADSHALHHHFNDVNAAAALSPLLKSKYKSSTVTGRVSLGPGAGAIGVHPALLSHDEKKKEDVDREEKLAQLQQPDPGLEAADRTPTVLRVKAQYTTPGGGPRRVPNALRTGTDSAALATTADALYAAPFLQLACRKATEREVAARLRVCVKKMTSKLHAIRVEGVKEAMAQLLQWATQASVESAERRREQQQQQMYADTLYQQYAGGYGAGSSPASSLIPGALILPPYDAVRVEVLGASSSPAAGGGHHYHRSSTLPSPRGGGGRAEEALLARAANAARSPSWDVVQQALEGVDYTSAIFNTILVPRLEVRNAMSTGMPISIQLSSEMALQWTTLPTPRNTAVAVHDDGTTPPRRNDLLHAATAVTYEEQELALRYIQGTCLTLYYQRRCCSEGCLIYYATEVFQCLRSHAEALFTWQRRELEGQEKGTHQQKSKQSHESGKRNSSGVDGEAARQTSASPAMSAVMRESAGRSQVAIDPALVRVVVALVEAVEAACHYNPSCLRRLVQTSCVTAMLNLAYCPFMPTSVRSTVLGTISVLLQEVNPLRRYVAAASKPGEGGGGAVVERNTDPLLQRMVENAMHDNPIGHNGKQIPYSTDRGSASKFDSAVRDWFFANGLGNVIPSVLQLQDLRSTFQSASFIIPQGMAGSPVGVGVAGPGGGGPGAAGVGGAVSAVANPASNLSFASLMASTGPSLHGPLTGRSFGGGAAVVVAGSVAGVGPGGAAGGGTAAAAAVAAATHANMQREGELYRKRVGRLLECMDGCELR
jgi:hypothetical protein